MSRINTNVALVGPKLLAQATSNIVAAQAELARIMQLLNSITVGGTVAANLETDPNWQIPAGTGQAFYTAVNAMKVNLATVTAASLGDLDAGA